MKLSLIITLIIPALTFDNFMSFEEMMSNKHCNHDCVSYSLNYFPHSSIMSKCGCKNSQLDTEKFLLSKNSSRDGLVDPII